MISAPTVDKLRDAFIAGVSDYTAARIAGCHHNTARSYRHVLEKLALIPVIAIREDRCGRSYDAEVMGAHVTPSRSPQSNVKRLAAIGGLSTKGAGKSECSIG